MVNIKKIISLIIITIVSISAIFINLKLNENMSINEIKTSIIQGFKTVKIIADKSSIDYGGLKFNVNMPVVDYEDKDIERYINTYIRKNINEFINLKKQKKDISKNYRGEKIDINYHVVFEDKNVLNILIYKDVYIKNKKYERIKDSYVFDLKTGQRIYLDNFLKNNQDYKDTIENYIINDANKKNIKIDKNKIKIDKYTNYYITNEGICVYFNPYQISNRKNIYDFKIPVTVFNNKIKDINTNPIVAQIDTQTITKNNEYINSIINVPIVITENKNIEKNINELIKNDIMNGYFEVEEEAKDFLKNTPKEYITPYIYNVDFDVKKNSDSMLSILIKIYQYSGGAHGYYENRSYNIFIENGQNLNLKDLFKENADYKKVINGLIRDEIKENKQEYSFKSISENQKFYIQDDKLVIYFDLYEIAPFAGGIPEFRISSDKINHILNEKYINIFK